MNENDSYLLSGSSRNAKKVDPGNHKSWKGIILAWLQSNIFCLKKKEKKSKLCLIPYRQNKEASRKTTWTTYSSCKTTESICVSECINPLFLRAINFSMSVICYCNGVPYELPELWDVQQLNAPYFCSSVIFARFLTMYCIASPFGFCVTKHK